MKALSSEVTPLKGGNTVSLRDRSWAVGVSAVTSGAIAISAFGLVTGCLLEWLTSFTTFLGLSGLALLASILVDFKERSR